MNDQQTDTAPSPTTVTVIGGGLAGSEAAWTLADLGIPVVLYEARPGWVGPAHHTHRFAELVCSNSFKSDDPTSATGELKRELAQMGSRLLEVARECAVPAGAALAVDRDLFSSKVSAALEAHPGITIHHHEATELPAEGPVIIATGPLTSPGFEPVLTALVGAERLSFFDAAAPIVDAASIDRSVVFAASRYGKGDGADYLNCPLDKETYERFRAELVEADRVQAKDFERGELFSACQPIEEIARSGEDAMRYGPLKPVGLDDPATGRWPHAVVQLRAETRARTAYNLVGFQTNLTFGAQERVFRLIPGLQDAVFVRYGVMHRNTFIDAPRILDKTLAVRTHPRVRIVGQLAGTEGYLEAIGTGLLGALNTASELRGEPHFVLPPESTLGSLIAYATDPETSSYQPMHVNWGIIPPLAQRVRGKRERYAVYAERADMATREAVQNHPLTRREEADSGD